MSAKERDRQWNPSNSPGHQHRNPNDRYSPNHNIQEDIRGEERYPAGDRGDDGKNLDKKKERRSKARRPPQELYVPRALRQRQQEKQPENAPSQPQGYEEPSRLQNRDKTVQEARLSDKQYTTSSARSPARSPGRSSQERRGKQDRGKREIREGGKRPRKSREKVRDKKSESKSHEQAPVSTDDSQRRYRTSDNVDIQTQDNVDIHVRTQDHVKSFRKQGDYVDERTEENEVGDATPVDSGSLHLYENELEPRGIDQNEGVGFDGELKESVLVEDKTVQPGFSESKARPAEGPIQDSADVSTERGECQLVILQPSECYTGNIEQECVGRHNQECDVVQQYPGTGMKNTPLDIASVVNEVAGKDIEMQMPDVEVGNRSLTGTTVTGIRTYGSEDVMANSENIERQEMQEERENIDHQSRENKDTERDGCQEIIEDSVKCEEAVDVSSQSKEDDITSDAIIPKAVYPHTVGTKTTKADLLRRTETSGYDKAVWENESKGKCEVLGESDQPSGMSQNTTNIESSKVNSPESVSQGSKFSEVEVGVCEGLETLQLDTTEETSQVQSPSSVLCDAPGNVRNAGGRENANPTERSDCQHVAVEEGEEDSSWDAMFDDSGECLNEDLTKELSKEVKKPKKKKIIVQKPEFDYYNYQPKDNFDYSDFGHVIEVFDFPAEFKTQDLVMAFHQFQSQGFDIKWVDDTHALAVFSSQIAANDALDTRHPMLKTRPIMMASREAKQKARKSVEFLQPYKARPQTSAMAARRLVSSALGIQSSVSREKRDAEKKKIKQAKEKKREVKKQKEDIWEGNV